MEDHGRGPVNNDRGENGAEVVGEPGDEVWALVKGVFWEGWQSRVVKTMVRSHDGLRGGVGKHVVTEEQWKTANGAAAVEMSGPLDRGRGGGGSAPPVLNCRFAGGLRRKRRESGDGVGSERRLLVCRKG